MSDTHVAPKITAQRENTREAINVNTRCAKRAIRAQSPYGRVARPEEVAYAVLFLASDGAKFSTGTIIDVNGASYLRS